MITAAKMMHPLPVRPFDRYTALVNGAPERAAGLTTMTTVAPGIDFGQMDKLVDALKANRRTNTGVQRPPMKPLPVIDPTL